MRKLNDVWNQASLKTLEVFRLNPLKRPEGGYTNLQVIIIILLRNTLILLYVPVCLLVASTVGSMKV